MAFRLQEALHQLEEGAGKHVLKYVAAVISFIAIAVMYDGFAFRNQSTAEGMDASQLARNIAEGRGYTTSFIRPFSAYLLHRKAAPEPGATPRNSGTNAALTLDVTAHPDLANPPLYPVLLAGALKLNPLGTTDLKNAADFRVYREDLWIACVNQGLLLLAAALVFAFAKQFFDEPVAWVSAAVFVGTELMWRFTLAGVSTMLLLAVFMGLALSLGRLDAASRDAEAAAGRLTRLALVAGLLLGLGTLTRYSFGLLAVPVLLFIGSVASPRRMALACFAGLAFMLVVTPWLARNFIVSGTPFGTAGYAIYQDTDVFPGNELERTLQPDFSVVGPSILPDKLFTGIRSAIQNDLPKFGGSWVSALFLASLLVPFRNPGLSRLRWLVLGCLGMLVLGQTLIRTGHSTEAAELSTENLIVIVTPLVFVFGVVLFFTLAEQFRAEFLATRYLFVGSFLALVSAPLLFALSFNHPNPITYPPYFPPWIQEKSHFVGPKELLMSDIPWATAWYGGRLSVWLPLKYRASHTEKLRNDFEAVHRTVAPVRALYLSSKMLKTFDLRALWSWIQLEDRTDWDRSIQDWEAFVLGTYLKQEVPSGFPLQRAPEAPYPELFLTDSEHMSGKSIQNRE